MLRVSLRDTSLRFADHLAEVKLEYPEHDFNHLGAEYLGVGYVATLANRSGDRLSVGVAPCHWALASNNPQFPIHDGGTSGQVVFFFGDWTEMPAHLTYKPETAWTFITDWLSAGV